MTPPPKKKADPTRRPTLSGGVQSLTPLINILSVFTTLLSR